MEEYKKNILRKRAEENLGNNKFHTKGNKNIKNWYNDIKNNLGKENSPQRMAKYKMISS